MPALLIVAVISFIVWIVSALLGRRFLRQMFWMGFLSVALFLVFLLLNMDWVFAVGGQPYFWLWIVSLFIITFCFAGVAAIAYEWIFHVRWKRPHHRHHHHVAILAIGPAIMFFGIALAPIYSLHLLLIGLVIDVILLLLLRHDLIVDGFFSGLFMGLTLTLLFSFLFAKIPGAIFEAWTLTGVTFLGIPAELILFFFLFGALWGPWYEVVKDYHPKAQA